MCIIEFLTGFGCVLVNLLQCDSRKRASLSCFFAHFLVTLDDANGAFMSVKIVVSPQEYEKVSHINFCKNTNSAEIDFQYCAGNGANISMETDSFQAMLLMSSNQFCLIFTLHGILFLFSHCETRDKERPLKANTEKTQRQKMLISKL